MARLSILEMDERLSKQKNYGGFINTFFLAEDKEHTIVKFLLDDIKDIEVYSVHEVKMTSQNGKDYRVSVSCHGDNCPLCKEAMKYDKQVFPLVGRARDNIYIPLIRLYNYKGEYEPTYQVFVRSTRFYRDTLAGAISRYGLDGYYEIERIGRKGDKKTSYSLYNITKDFEGRPLDMDKSIDSFKDDFEVRPDDIFGRRDSLIRDWTVDEFEEFLETGTYPKGKKEEKVEEDEEVEIKPRSRSSRHGF